MYLQSQQPRNKKVIWSQEDKKALLEMAGTEPIESIAKKLGKTARQTINQCGRSYINYRYPPVN